MNLMAVPLRFEHLCPVFTLLYRQYFMELLQFQIRQPDLCSSQPVLRQITYCAKVAFAKLNAPSGDTYTPDR